MSVVGIKLFYKIIIFIPTNPIFIIYSCICDQEGLLIGIGNPLLDISAIVDEDLLNKYNLKPDDAIMAGETHMPLYRELMDK